MNTERERERATITWSKEETLFEEKQQSEYILQSLYVQKPFKKEREGVLQDWKWKELI